MKGLINNNLMKTQYLAVTAKGILNKIAVLRDVHPVYRQDANGNKTDEIVAYRYELVDAETFANFTVKVEGAKPIVTAETVELSPEPIYVEIPLEGTLIKPYAIEFGMAKVSITASSLKLQKS